MRLWWVGLTRVLSCCHFHLMSYSFAPSGTMLLNVGSIGQTILFLFSLAPNFLLGSVYVSCIPKEDFKLASWNLVQHNIKLMLPSKGKAWYSQWSKKVSTGTQIEAPQSRLFFIKNIAKLILREHFFLLNTNKAYAFHFFWPNVLIWKRLIICLLKYHRSVLLPVGHNSSFLCFYFAVLVLPCLAVNWSYS